jgi:hypothetical protein
MRARSGHSPTAWQWVKSTHSRSAIGSECLDQFFCRVAVVLPSRTDPIIIIRRLHDEQAKPPQSSLSGTLGSQPIRLSWSNQKHQTSAATMSILWSIISPKTRILR